MTTPTGNITLGDVAIELGIALPLTLGDSRVRTLAGKPSGDITLGDLRGKSAYSPPSVTVDSTSLSHFEFGQNGTSGYSSIVGSLTITGGEAPFTVSWSRTGGSSQISVGGTTSPSFAASGTMPFDYQATFRATVTDKRGAQAQSPDVYVQLSAGSNLS